jgi:hypothetical protein
MEFLNRHNELQRLRSFSRSENGSLAVVYGRRRLGKSRLLLEWAKKQNACYFVADQSAGSVQRDYFARAIETVIPGFSAGPIRAFSSWCKSSY